MTLTLAPMAEAAESDVAESDEPEVLVPADLQARSFLNALTFDRNLAARAEGELVVAVLIQRRYRPSVEAGRDLLDALGKLPPDMVPGLRLRAVPLEPGDGDDLAALVDRLRPVVLYVTPLRALSVDEVTAITRPRQVRTLTAVPGYVEAGVALGLRLHDGRPEILVNLAAARAEGADFASQLLKLARVIR